MDGISECRPRGEVLGGLLRILHATAFLYPMILVSSFYGAWLAAWLILARPPRPSWDDPADTLGGIYWAIGVVFPLMPMAAAATICSIVSRFVFGGYSKLTGSALALLTVVLWAGAILHLRSDPIGVVNWWFD